MIINLFFQLILAGVSISTTGAGLIYNKATDIDAPGQIALNGLSSMYSFIKDNIYVIVGLTVLSMVLTFITHKIGNLGHHNTNK